MNIRNLGVVALIPAALMMPGAALTQTPLPPRVPPQTTGAAKTIPVAPNGQKFAPRSVDVRTTGFAVLRQDLFDRYNPNNLRSDWPGPPAQPGQFR
jgi:hypothetical protein